MMPDTCINQIRCDTGTLSVQMDNVSQKEKFFITAILSSIRWSTLYASWLLIPAFTER